ncbi:MAG: prepilin-type N-terminal cleavage/methylation domain-containing protein [Phycisphaerae bacterium]|nr:prepilin-type N-terminal cleavage/methylation domain-containing protein [Phycisphaerae bacterium]
MLKNSIHDKRKAFTLIELLVVIAIISLLVSILLPSLQKAKALAMQVVCLARLHGIGASLILYQADFNGRGPVGFTKGGNCWGSYRHDPFFDNNQYYYKPGDAWWDGTGWYSKKSEKSYLSKWKDASGNPGADCLSLGDYLERSGDFVGSKDPLKGDGGAAASPVACPASEGVISSSTGIRAGYSFNYWLGYDVFLGDFLTNPADNPMLMDGSGENIHNTWDLEMSPRPGEPWPWWETENPPNFYYCSQYHAGSGNFLFFDGHTEKPIAPDISVTDGYDAYLQYYWDLWDWQGIW